MNTELCNFLVFKSYIYFPLCRCCFTKKITIELTSEDVALKQHHSPRTAIVSCSAKSAFPQLLRRTIVFWFRSHYQPFKRVCLLDKATRISYRIFARLSPPWMRRRMEERHCQTPYSQDSYEDNLLSRHIAPKPKRCTVRRAFSRVGFASQSRSSRGYKYTTRTGNVSLFAQKFFLPCVGGTPRNVNI